MRKTSLTAALLFLAFIAAHNPAAAAQPVRVFILAGQSNMEGAGQIKANPARNGGQGSLEFLVKDAATAKRFAALVDSSGKWRVRDDVWISYLDRKGPLTAGFGARRETMGPELGFGWVMGDALEGPVLLVKCAWGGKSLAFRRWPPRSATWIMSCHGTRTLGVHPIEYKPKLSAALDTREVKAGCLCLGYQVKEAARTRKTEANDENFHRPEVEGWNGKSV